MWLITSLKHTYHPLPCSPPPSPAALLAHPTDDEVMVVLDRPRGVYTGQHRGRRIGDMARDSRQLRLRLLIQLERSRLERV
ncbi:hypothetical protein PspLS_03161 [Pyricularia sp. CBS 133598]|nr:hypothetical protein PspLS_03161 [Pyricularia sp. CBS 133598]